MCASLNKRLIKQQMSLKWIFKRSFNLIAFFCERETISVTSKSVTFRGNVENIYFFIKTNLSNWKRKYLVFCEKDSKSTIYRPTKQVIQRLIKITLKSSLQAGEMVCTLNTIARCTAACRCKTNVALPIKRPIKIVLSQQMARCIASTTFTSIEYYQNMTSCHRFEVSYQLPPNI